MDMKVKVEIDSSRTEPEVIILTDRMTDEVKTILSRLQSEETGMLAGFRNDTVTVMDPKSILRIFAANGKVYAVTQAGEYVLHLRLYELEEKLRSEHFVRISVSELVNLKMVKHFDLSFTGTICVILTDGTKTFVSRRYVPKIKSILGM